MNLANRPKFKGSERGAKKNVLIFYQRRFVKSRIQMVRTLTDFTIRKVTVINLVLMNKICALYTQGCCGIL